MGQSDIQAGCMAARCEGSLLQLLLLLSCLHDAPVSCAA